jgi:hypothetical protein
VQRLGCPRRGTPPWSQAPGLGFLLGTIAVETGPILSADIDPAAAWAVVRDAIQRGRADPAISIRVEGCGQPRRLSFEGAVDMTCTSDVRRAPCSYTRRS